LEDRRQNAFRAGPQTMANREITSPTRNRNVVFWQISL